MIWWIFILSLSFSIISICIFIISPQSRYRIFPASQKRLLCLFLANLHLFPLLYKDFLVVQMVKSLPATQETWVQSLGWDWEGEGNGNLIILSPGEGNGNSFQYSRLENFMGSQRVRHNWVLLTHIRNPL